MDPLLIAIVIGYFISNGVRDAAYAVRGKDSPRQAARRARVDSGAPTVVTAVSARAAERIANGKPAKRPKPAKTGARKYLSDLNGDVFAAATVRRREMAANRARRRAARIARRPEGQARPVAQPAVVGLGHDPQEQDQPVDAHPTPEMTLNSGADADTTPIGGDLEPWPTVPDTIPDDLDPDRPPEGTQQGGTMTQIAAAEGGLTSCLNWCNDMLAQFENAGPAFERTAAYLESQQVSGPAVDGLRQAMDQFQGIAANLAAARDDLQSQLSIKDAYAANPGAGTKEFILTE